MAYNEYTWKPQELITAEKLNNLEDRIKLSHNLLNITDFGATGDGITDDTSAIKETIDHAKDKGSSVFFPSGNYVLSEEIFVNNFDLIGENRENTNVIVKGLVGFSLGNGKISNITIDLTQSVDDVRALTLGLSKDNKFIPGNDAQINRVYIKGTFSKPNTTGIYVHPYSDSQSNTTGVWGNNIYDVIMRSIGTGINLTAGAYGFINGNAFENILIKGFYKNGVLIDSDSPNAYTNQRNYFKHVQVQANGNYALKNAVAYNIKHGQNNIFDGVTEWNDTGGIDDIIAVNFETSQGSPAIYDIINNRFTNSKFEHKITGDSRLLYLNTIKANVINFSVGKYLTGTSKHFDLLDTSKIKNLLDSEIIYSEIVDSGNNGLTISGKTGTTIGKNGSELVLSGESSSVLLNLNPNQVGRTFSSKFLTISIAFSCSDISNLNIDNALTIKNSSGGSVTVGATKIFATNTTTGYEYHLLYDLTNINSSILLVNSTITGSITFNGGGNINLSKIKMTNYPNIAMSKYEDCFVNQHLLKLGNTMLRINGSTIQKTTDNGTNWTNL